MIETLLKWLILIHDGDMAYLVKLMEALYSMLNELSELYSTFDRVRHAFDHDVVSGGWGGSRRRISFCRGSSVEQLMGSLKVAADADATFDANLVRRKHFLRLLNAHVLVCHLERSPLLAFGFLEFIILTKRR